MPNPLEPIVVALAIPVTFLLLVAPHEGGHFALAKLFQVRVIEYSIFLGTRIWSTVRGGTMYSLRTIPLGGYVRLGGMEPGDYDDPRGFHRKAAYQRLLILLAGPATNFLVAALIVTGLTMTQLNGDPGKIVGVFQCADTTKSPPCDPSPAWAAGLRPNDSIQSVNGQSVKQPEDIRRLEAAHPDQPLQMVVRKPDGRTVSVSVTPQFDSTQHMYLIGIENAPVIGVKDALTRGATFPFQLTGAIAVGLYQVASGQISGGFFGPSGLTGPVGIGYVTVESALGGWLAWLTVVAILSVALGLANLLPIPSLDGARMVVVLLEKLIGHPFNRELEMQVQRAGLYALLLLIAVISVFDVERIVSGQFPPIK